MDWIYLGIVVFLFALAAFDLYVGVSNDAVNFLNSGVGSRAAKFRTLVIVASVGVVAGCVLSNGMMDIARHGIFAPQHFTFHEVMYIYVAVMVTDIVLLDIFNTYGMPTSTTVSMVFELLGASFALVLVKMAGDAGMLGFEDYLNTSKALEVVMGIFLSVPLAFIFGSLVQYVTRIIFTFNLTKVGAKIGVYGGVAVTAIIYFMLFKGLKDLSFMSPDVKAFIQEHTLVLLGATFLVSTIVMQLLHALRVSVLRVIVLLGTLALATAFAGNDLVNFIGVPLAGFSSYQDYMANGTALGPDGFMMTSLLDSATTPLYFLVAAGLIMVYALATSKKARKVIQTEVGLSRKEEGDEMFGSSRAARSLVRWTGSAASFIAEHTPQRVIRFVDKRFAMPADAKDDGSAYDLLRASVNLVVASLLIALGTSLKMPLSTTFVTFMVAMGTSLADRAWSRESAVFRITGVLTVIGSWFLTAGVAFTACFVVALIVYFGGITAVVIVVALGIFSIIHSQRQFARRQKEVQTGDVLFTEMIHCNDRTAIAPMLERHLVVSTAEAVESFADLMDRTTRGLLDESYRTLHRAGRELALSKQQLKNLRRRETICLRRAAPATGVRLSTTFHLVHNSLRQLRYGVLRINEPALEHVDNNFTPIDGENAEMYSRLRDRLVDAMKRAAGLLRTGTPAQLEALREELRTLREELAAYRGKIQMQLQTPDTNLTAATLLLHVVQETEQTAIEMRLLLKSVGKFHELI